MIGGKARRPPGHSLKARDLFDIYTIIFLVLAVFIFLRLRSVLGQKTGRERPPYDPYTQAREPVRTSTNDNVVTLPPRNAEAAPKGAEDEPAPVERWKGIAEAGSSTALGLDALAAQDPAFDEKHFVAGLHRTFITALRQRHDVVVGRGAQRIAPGHRLMLVGRARRPRAAGPLPEDAAQPQENEHCEHEEYDGVDVEQVACFQAVSGRPAGIADRDYLSIRMKPFQWP